MDDIWNWYLLTLWFDSEHGCGLKFVSNSIWSRLWSIFLSARQWQGDWLLTLEHAFLCQFTFSTKYFLFWRRCLTEYVLTEQCFSLSGKSDFFLSNWSHRNTKSKPIETYYNIGFVPIKMFFVDKPIGNF